MRRLIAAEGGTLHEFLWTGDLSGYGSHLGGTFTYEDSWRDPAGGTGSLSVPGAEFTGNLAE